MEMPFGPGFNLLDFSTYKTSDYIVLGAILVVLLFLIILPFLLKGKKKVTKKSTPKGSKNSLKETVFKSESGEKIIFEDLTAWHVNENGQTKLLKAVLEEPRFFGNVTYLTKDSKKVTVNVNGDEITRTATVEKEYVTFEFISKDELHFGKKTFLTQTQIDVNNENARVEALKFQKEQEKADYKALKLQEKLDKKNSKK